MNRANYRYRRPYRQNYQPRYRYNQRTESGTNGSRSDRADDAALGVSKDLPQAALNVVSNLAAVTLPLAVIADNAAGNVPVRGAKKDDKVLCYHCENSGHKADICYLYGFFVFVQ
jgi:hypothetical protein